MNTKRAFVKAESETNVGLWVKQEIGVLFQAAPVALLPTEQWNFQIVYARKHQFELENYLLREAAIDLEFDDHFYVGIVLVVFYICYFFLLFATPPTEHVNAIDCSADSDERRTDENIDIEV